MAAAAPNTSTVETQSTQHQNQPLFPKFADQMIRLQTFGGWPETSKKKPVHLANAGFFHNQAENQVICFSCGYAKSAEWRARDDPWKTHALDCRGSCDYLTMVKGSNFTTKVKRDYSEKRSMIIWKRIQRQRMRDHLSLTE